MQPRELRKLPILVREKLESIAEGHVLSSATIPPEPGPPAGTVAASRRRFLSRVGLLRNKTPRGEEEEQRLLDEIAGRSGLAIEEVRRLFDLYSSGGEQAVPRTICGEPPLCFECPLTAMCKYFHRKPNITDLPEDERPRERLMHEGDEALTNAELLAIIIRSGTQQETAVELARRLLARFGSFRELGSRSVAELCDVKGIGPAKAVQIKAAIAIARRLWQNDALPPGAQFKHSEDIFNCYHGRLRDVKKETFIAVLLDSKHRVIKDVVVSEGSLTTSIVHPREVFNPAIRESAQAVVFVHNHPSGDPTPSTHDVEVTERLINTSKVVGIKVRANQKVELNGFGAVMGDY